MNRIQKALILIAAIAAPAAAYSSLAPRHDSLCFASGSATYRIARDTAMPDFRVKIAGEVANPDLRMQLVDNPESADFVLVDDFTAREQAPCRSSTPIRTVMLDPGEAAPDVTVALSADDRPVDYRIYVHSLRYSQQDAAALLAAMWTADRRREVMAVAAAGGDRSKMTDRIKPASTTVAVTPDE